jgi:hypothetical protein
MEILSGDVYVFVSEYTERPWHFINFEIGQKYVVSSIEKIIGFDEYILSGVVVSFENTIYSVYENEFVKYFVSIDTYRESRIEKLYV